MKYHGAYTDFVSLILRVRAGGKSATDISKACAKAAGVTWTEWPSQFSPYPSAAMVRFICKREGYLFVRKRGRPTLRKFLARRNPGRVIDMGGPRDVWLHFVAGPEAWR